MRFLLIPTILCFAFSSAIAQNVDLPKNPKPGKCYERCFYYDKPLEWKEVDCKKSKATGSNGVNVFHVRKTDEETTKFITYQKQLVDLGYTLAANGILDEKTIKAHHKYLKFKKKQDRKAKRTSRK